MKYFKIVFISLSFLFFGFCNAYNLPQDFINAGYVPKLKPNYKFPVIKQSLNGCYFYAVRNVLKYKYGIGIYLPKVLGYIGFDGSSLSDSVIQNKFLNAINTQIKTSTNIKTLFEKLRDGEPVLVSYIYQYKNKNGDLKKINHTVATYSFDTTGIWVAETVQNKLVRVNRDEVFDKKGKTKCNAIRSFTIIQYSGWSNEQKILEKKYNFIKGEEFLK